MNPKNYPKVNIASLLQRANDLITVCSRDKEYLQRYGLTDSMITELDRLFVQSEQAFVDHAMCRDTLDEKQCSLAHYYKEAYILRSNLAEHIKRLCRLLHIEFKLPSYSSRKQQADLVQDLHDLATVCRTYKEQFISQQFDPTLIDHAFTLSEMLSHVIVDVTVYRESVLADALQKRNEIFIQTRQLMLTICVIGRNAYNDNPDARKNFSCVG
jgi:predicted DNA-binding protein YlxM (UPF0122 family)